MPKQIGFTIQPNDLIDEKPTTSNSLGFTISDGKEAKMKYLGKVLIPIDIYEKLFMYTICMKKEVSGMGLVEVIDGNIVIKDLFILKQEVSYSNTVIDNEDLAKKVIEIINTGDDPSKMKLWWHSHAQMGVCWSQTDETCCDNYDNDMWMVSIVVNKDKKILCRLDIYKPFRIVLDNVPVEITTNTTLTNSGLQQQCLSDLKEKVTEKVHRVITTPGCAWMSRNKPLDTDKKLTHYLTLKEMRKLVNKNKTISNKNFEELFYGFKPSYYRGMTIIDILGFAWTWSVNTQSYDCFYGSRLVYPTEYGIITKKILQGETSTKIINTLDKNDQLEIINAETLSNANC